MARLYRPYIPLEVRVLVAVRHLVGVGGQPPPRCGTSAGAYLRRLLVLTFGHDNVELHHRPALMNRVRHTMKSGGVFYEPPANSPEYLVYLLPDDHDVETRVRGVGALRSDQGQQRYLKKVAKNRLKREGKKLRRPSGGLHRTPAGARFQVRAFAKGAGRIRSRPWPSRKVRTKKNSTRSRRRSSP